ncbi:MAG TPA: BTAD domain-containing putative transcriptional regulator [Anaerolineales bacterium]|nr:BTAD domain-containing putative transcriptional regulator [Anaerolineales bacterium]
MLEEAYHFRLTMLQAGAGSGKTTELAIFGREGHPLIWYQVFREDSDPLVFLLQLMYATRQALPNLQGLPILFLEAWDGARGPLPSIEVANQYMNALSGLDTHTLLVLDDLHLISEAPEIQKILGSLIDRAPPHFHFLFSARFRAEFPSLNRWRSRGGVLTIGQGELAFTPDEITALFTGPYGYELTRDEANALYAATEGWAITLPLIWQSLRSGAAATIEDALAMQPASLESLFEILADEVLAMQPKDVQEFLKASATLQLMTPEACDYLRETTDSAQMLAYLRREELFVIEEAGTGTRDRLHLRYQHVFHRFLRQRIQNDVQRKKWNLRAAEYFQAQRDPASAIYHLLKGEDAMGAAELLADYGRLLIANGRLETLAGYLDQLSPEVLHHFPVLLTYMGDLARLHSRFQEALEWYQQAEVIWRERGNKEGIGRALRGQARIYLDTVNPKRAEKLLQDALQISDGIADREAQARLYELLAENKLNSGKPQEAERLRTQAAALRQEVPDESQLLYRVLLRTGRLNEARLKLEDQAEAERQHPVQTPRAHRETQLLLSIIYAFFGEPNLALQAALEGTRRGAELDSPWVAAVGYMRQGHALMLFPGDTRTQEAAGQFEKAIELSRTLATPRLRIEACWGLCRVYGFRGDLMNAREVATEGLQIAVQVGDEWIASLIRLAMGASLILAGRYEAAPEWLDEAAQSLRECSDPFGEVVALLWRCMGYFRQGNHEPLAQIFPSMLAVCRENNYDFLFTRPTILGPPDERILIPLLILARQKGWEPAYAAQLLEMLGLPDIALHPGYQLRVFTLGAFQVWRGPQSISPQEWERKQSRHLFQLFLTFRNQPLTREQILEHLWPEDDPQSAERKFKTALNTLYRVLEPARTPGADSAYVFRNGICYQLRPEADLWLDADEFLKNLRQVDGTRRKEAATAPLEQAVSLYKGEYLPEARYETWAAAEREHLAVQYMRAADQLCEQYLENNRVENVIALCQQILSYDNCWERAYRYLMTAYSHLGDHGQIARTYNRCVETLHKELDVLPAAETDELYLQLTRGNR